MTVNFRVTHRDHRGNTKKVMDRLYYMSYTLPTRTYGVANLRLPADYGFTSIKDYDRIRIERNGVIEGDTDWFILNYGYGEDSNGREYIKIKAFSALFLIFGPIARHYAGYSKALIEDLEADDIIKRIVRENMGVDTEDSTRMLLSELFEVEAPTAFADVDSKGFSNRRISDVIQQIAEKNGVYYDVVLKNTRDNKLIFKVFYPYRGFDKSADLIFSKKKKNLKRPDLEYVYSEEYVITYGLGEGDGPNRVVQFSRNIPRRDHPWARVREATVSVNSKTAAIIAAEAAGKQANHGPYVKVSGTLVDTEETQYGRDWQRGDVISIKHHDIIVPATIYSVANTYQNNREDVQAEIQGVIT